MVYLGAGRAAKEFLFFLDRGSANRVATMKAGLFGRMLHGVKCQELKVQKA
jgi:hypothetical protein